MRFERAFQLRCADPHQSPRIRKPRLALGRLHYPIDAVALRRVLGPNGLALRAAVSSEPERSGGEHVAVGRTIQGQHLRVARAEVERREPKRGPIDPSQLTTELHDET